MYDCAGAKTGYPRPGGEWSFKEIEVRDHVLMVTLNGIKILGMDIHQIDRSLLPKAPKGLDRYQGSIDCAGHSAPVSFRSFRGIRRP